MLTRSSKPPRSKQFKRLDTSRIFRRKKMTESVTIKVEGMVCAACQSHVQRALDATPGVSKAAVNLMTGQAVVAFDPVAVAPQNLVQAILDTGYEAELPRSGRSAIEEQEERERDQVTEARELTLKAIVS